MSSKTLPPPKKQRIRRRYLGSTYHPVERYTFEPCSTPGCFQLHVPAATGDSRCPECLQNECDIPDCWACKMEGGA